VAEYLSEQGLCLPILHLGLPDTFIDHGKREKILSTLGLDAKGIQQSISTRLALLSNTPPLAIND